MTLVKLWLQLVSLGTQVLFEGQKFITLRFWQFRWVVPREYFGYRAGTGCHYICTQTSREKHGDIFILFFNLRITLTSILYPSDVLLFMKSKKKSSVVHFSYLKWTWKSTFHEICTSHYLERVTNSRFLLTVVTLEKSLFGAGESVLISTIAMHLSFQ